MVPLEGAEVPDPDQRGAEGLRAGSKESVLIAHSRGRDFPWRSRLLAGLLMANAQRLHPFTLARTTRPTVVWSQWSGYLKKGGPVPGFCVENGIEPYIIHSGGHAHPEDLADLARRLHARAVVPIHTEAASQFAAFIPNVRIVTDG